MEFTLEELEQELARREEQEKTLKDDVINFKNKVSDETFKSMKAFGYGLASGGFDITLLPFFPVEIAAEYNKDQKSYVKGVRQFQPKEADFKGYENYFRAGEGFATGAPFGLFAGLPGGVIAGTAGGITNIIGKELFPKSPIAQSIISMISPGASMLLKARGMNVPKDISPVVDPETGVMETKGTATKDPEKMFEENKMRTTLQGKPMATSFDIAQASSMDDFMSRIQSFTDNEKLTPKTITQGIYKAHKDYSLKLTNEFKNNSKINFNRAKAIAGNNDIIPTDNTQQTIDSLINQYSNIEVPGVQSIVNNLKTIKKELTDVKTEKIEGRIVDEKGNLIIQPRTIIQKEAKNINLERLKQNISAWGEAAYKGTYKGLEDNLSPGQVKGIARRILNGFKKDLDSAANLNIPGARELKEARTNYANDLKKLEEYFDKPLVKYFDKPSAESLVPEEVINRFNIYPPTQRAELIQVLENSGRQDIIQSLRKQAFDNIMSGARSTIKASEDAPSFNFSKALSSFDQVDKDKIKWLFPTKQEENQFKASIKQMQRIQANSKFTDPDAQLMRQGGQVLEEGSGALAGAKAKYGVQFLIDGLRLVVSSKNPEKLSMLMFHPSGKKIIQEISKDKPNLNTISKLYDNYNLGAVGAGVTAAKEVPSPREQLIDSQPIETDFTLKELEEELRRRQGL